MCLYALIEIPVATINAGPKNASKIGDMLFVFVPLGVYN